jgi:hypothetical protein
MNGLSVSGFATDMRGTKSTQREKATSTMITISQVFRLRMIHSINPQKYQPLAGAA